MIDTGHKTILHLAQRFGLQTVDLLHAQPMGAEDTYFFFNKYYLQKTADGDFAQVHNVLGARYRMAPFPTLYNSFTPAGYQLDHLSLYDWIEQYVTGGHGSNMGQFLDVAYNEEYGRETKEQSSLNLVYLLGFQPKPGSFTSSANRMSATTSSVGTSNCPRPWQTIYPAGSIHLNWRMTAIVNNSDGSSTLAFSTPSGKQAATFDRVI